MSIIKVALLQMFPYGNNQRKNLEKGDKFCRKASELGADIALFPEMWNIGYTPYHPEVWDHDYNPLNPKYPELREKWKQQAISQSDDFIVHFTNLAKELDMAIAITYLEKWPGLPRNSMALIDRHGKIVMTYAKVHTCDFSLEAACTPGEDFCVCDLNTKSGDIKVGAMICYDREFPESARILMLKGAEIILIPNACEMDINRTTQLRARAFENMVAIALANYAGEEHGNSMAYDGMAYDENGKSRDMLVIKAGKSEGIYIAEFDMDKLRDYRRRETWGNAFRKPDRYTMLISPEVNEPFIRKEARR